MTDLATILADAVTRLDGVPDDALGTVQTRRFRPMRIVPVGRAWRLGDVLITRTGTLYRAGRTTRALEPKQFLANKSNEALERAEIQRAAVRGGFGKGETVHFGHEPIDAVLVDGVWMIAWSRSQPGLVPLAEYLKDRIAMLTEGA